MFRHDYVQVNGIRLHDASGRDVLVPTLLIVGEKEGFALTDWFDWFERRVPHGTLVRIPNTGHRVIHEQSALVTAHLQAFIEQNQAQQPISMVVLLGEEATVKRLRQQGKRLFLEAANAAYAPIPLTRQSPTPWILGTVAGVYRDRRRRH